MNKLDTYDNLLLLCPTHHTMIDADNGSGYSVDDLLKLKKDHEETQERKRGVEKTILAYLADQYIDDDKVLFEQVDLHGPSVDAMFVDVPFACRADSVAAELMDRISSEYPGDREALEDADGWVVTGAAQALLHPEWSGNALLVGGPGQGKSTLLQYVCQFHRSRHLGKNTYQGRSHQLTRITETHRIPIRLDLRKYAAWANATMLKDKTSKDRFKNSSGKDRRGRDRGPKWPSIEQYIALEIKDGSGGRPFRIEHLGLLVSTEPVLLALDGLDEVANLKHREQVSAEIVRTQARLSADALDLVVLVATRPGTTTSELWSSKAFPTRYLRRLSHGLRLQYLQQWAKVAKLSATATAKLQKTFLDNQHVPHIRELASYPMQLAILLHLLHRRQLLPQQRTDLYKEYLKTFLDREQTEDKEPLLNEERQVIEDIHAFLGWYLQSKSEEGTSSGAISRSDLDKLLHEHLAGRDDGQELAKQLFSAFSSRVLCLIERETGSYQFEVQSLREYFAALYIFENAPTKGSGNSRDDCLNALLERPYWSNVCRFFVGMFSKVEVRGIRQNLYDLSRKGDLARHPHLRSLSALFLDDRTYEGQSDEPIQEAVDFVLAGPGILLGEEGLLDFSGAALQFSERAGRAQATKHAKKRLITEPSRHVRVALAQSLRRHAVDEDRVSEWWWAQFQPETSWLHTAAQLRVLGSAPDRQADLARLAAHFSSGDAWLSHLLAQGGYNGISQEILNLCKEDINSGAADVAGQTGNKSSIGILYDCAAAALGRRYTVRETNSPAKDSAKPPSLPQRYANMPLITAMAKAAEQLKVRPRESDLAADWHKRLTLVADTWGDGWVLRRAAGLIVRQQTLAEVAGHVTTVQCHLAKVLQLEQDARSNRTNAGWWVGRLSACDSTIDQLHWVLSLLTTAASSAVKVLANDLTRIVDQMQPKQVAVLHESIASFRQRVAVPPIKLADELRLSQVTLSPRCLWLIRAIASEGTVEQIDRHLQDSYEALLSGGLGDMRELLRRVGSHKKIKIESLRSTRDALPPGGWSSDIKLGAIRPALARQILGEPEAWPSDITQRAVQVIAAEMAARAKSLAAVAIADEWFAQTS